MKKLLPHFFVSSSDGGLYDTRKPNWHQAPPLRAVFSRHYTPIENTAELRATLRAGSHAWPGGYPLYFITSDGGALSFETVRANLLQVVSAIRHDNDDGWKVVSMAINWEDNELTDEHTGKPIEPAYHS